MHTRCPGCHAVFRIVQADLDAADGWVRCGECDTVFDAGPSLQRELPLDSDADAVIDGRSANEEAAVDHRGANAGQTLPGVLLSELEGASAGDGSRGQSGWHIAGWAAVNCALLGLLLLQLVFAQRAAFAQVPALRPVLTQMCAVADCTLPSRRAVDRIEVVRRHVYSHPNEDNALLIDVTLVNQADFAQPFPVLTVTLGDRNGEPVSRRHLEPNEYDPDLAANARMAPGSPKNIVVEVRDPGPQARTFNLDFH